MKVLVIGLSALLVGCYATQAVVLKHPQTRKTVTCPSIGYAPVTAGAVTAEHLKCIEDFQRQGFERVAE